LIFATKKEQRLKITKNAYNVSKILTKILIIQNYFQELSLLNNKFVRSFIITKINSILHIINISYGSSRNLGWSCNMWGRGGRAGSSYELDAAQSIQSKFFSLFWTFWAASYGRQFKFLLLVMKKDTYNDIFARRLLKTK
jgi:hypothetical protein